MTVSTPAQEATRLREFEFSLAGHINAHSSAYPAVRLVMDLRNLKHQMPLVVPGPLLSPYLSSAMQDGEPAAVEPARPAVATDARQQVDGHSQPVKSPPKLGSEARSAATLSPTDLELPKTRHSAQSRVTDPSANPHDSDLVESPAATEDREVESCEGGSPRDPVETGAVDLPGLPPAKFVSAPTTSSESSLSGSSESEELNESFAVQGSAGATGEAPSLPDTTSGSPNEALPALSKLGPSAANELARVPSSSEVDSSHSTEPRLESRASDDKLIPLVDRLDKPFKQDTALEVESGTSSLPGKLAPGGPMKAVDDNSEPERPDHEPAFVWERASRQRRRRAANVPKLSTGDLIETSARGIVPSVELASTKAQVRRRAERAEQAELQAKEDRTEARRPAGSGHKDLPIDSRLTLLLIGLISLVGFAAVCVWLVVSSRTETEPPEVAPPSVRAVVPDYVPGATPVVVPAVIQAEDYDDGGPGVAYVDSDDVNSGNIYRSDGVDIVAPPGQASKLVVADTKEGEWLKYTIEVPVGAKYEITTGVSSSIAEPGSVDVLIDGNRIGTFYGEQPASDFEFTTQALGEVELEAGTHELTLSFSGNAGILIDWLEVARA